MPIIRKCWKKTNFCGGPHPFVYHAFGYVMQPSFSIQIRAFPATKQTAFLYMYIYGTSSPWIGLFCISISSGLLGKFSKSLWLPIATSDTGLTNQPQRFHENQPFNGHLFLAWPAWSFLEEGSSCFRPKDDLHNQGNQRGNVQNLDDTPLYWNWLINRESLYWHISLKNLFSFSSPYINQETRVNWSLLNCYVQSSLEAARNPFLTRQETLRFVRPCAVCETIQKNCQQNRKGSSWR